MRYSGASAFDLAMNAAWVWPSRAGGGSVRDVTGTPTAMKNSSCPDGVHVQSSRAASPAALRKASGALARTLTVSPARATKFSPRKLSSSSPSRTVNFSSKS